MAVVPRSETTKGLNMRIQLPTTKVAAQCIEEEFAEAKDSKNFHIHRKWQVIQAPTVVVNGDNIDLAGVDLDQYLTVKWSDGKGGYLPQSDDKVKKGLGRVYENFDILKLDCGDIDTDNPPLICKGIVADVTMESKGQPLLAPLTQEQLQAGMKKGSPRLDDDGKPIQIFRPNITYFTGRSTVEPKPF